MNNWILLAAPLTVAVAGAAIVLYFALRTRSSRPSTPSGRQPDNTFVCTVCAHGFPVSPTEFQPLLPVEMALVVSRIPGMQGRKLVERECPKCQASHCFAVDGGMAVWVGANLYTPQAETVRCKECGRFIQPYPWQKGLYDGRLEEAPFLKPEFGLFCKFCRAVLCVSCVEAFTKRSSRTEPLRCPRCRRKPVDTLYSP